MILMCCLHKFELNSNKSPCNKNSVIEVPQYFPLFWNDPENTENAENMEETQLFYDLLTIKIISLKYGGLD